MDVSAARRLVVAVEATDLLKAREFLERANLYGSGVMARIGIELLLTATAQELEALVPSGYRLPIIIDLTFGSTASKELRDCLQRVMSSTCLQMSFIMVRNDHVGLMRKLLGELGAHGTQVLRTTIGSEIEPRLHSAPGALTKKILRAAGKALEDGAHGIVCPARETAAVREELGSAPVIVSTGIRLPEIGAEEGSPTPLITPRQGIEMGATLLLVGRSVREHADPAQAVRDLVSAIAQVMPTHRPIPPSA